MKTIIENQKQLSLFSDIVGQEIDYKNDFVTYIDSSSNDKNVVHSKTVTSNTHKTANTQTNNIEISLKSVKNKHSALNAISRIEALQNESLEDFKNKYESTIYKEQDRRLGRIQPATT